MAVDEETFVARNQREKGRTKRRVKFLRARGSAELEKIASGPATQGPCWETEMWDLG